MSSRGSRDSGNSRSSRSSRSSDSDDNETPRRVMTEAERIYRDPKSSRKKPTINRGTNDWGAIIKDDAKKLIYKRRVNNTQIKEGTIFSAGPEGPILKKISIKYMRFRDNILVSDIFILTDGSAIYSHGTYYWDYDHDNFSVSYKNEENNNIYLLYPHEIEGIVYPNDGEDYKLLQQAISQYKFSKPQTAGGQTTKKRGPAKTKKRSIQ